MDSNTIRSILDKYWEGESSLQEEATLREYFSRDDIPAEFESIRPMFQFFKNEQEAFLNGDFEERLSSKLKAADNVKPRSHSLTFYIKRAAAVAAIFIGVLFFVSKTTIFQVDDDLAGTTIDMDEKAEALAAYAEAKAALMLISKKLNKGTDKAQSGVIKVRRATNMIKE